MTNVKRIEVPIPYPVKWVNCYFIDDSVPTLIDTGVNTDDAFDAIVKGVRTEGRKLEDIRRIIVTHGHLDHAGMAGRIAAIAGAEVFLHRCDTSIGLGTTIERSEASREGFRTFLQQGGVPEHLVEKIVESIVLRSRKMFGPVARTSPLNGGSSFEFDDMVLEAIHTPGHSRGSVCLLDHDGGLLFSGDVLLEEITCNPLMQTSSSGRSAPYRALPSQQASFERILALPVKQVMPGHGRPFADCSRRIRRLQKHHERRRELILQALDQARIDPTRKNGVSQFTIAESLFPSMRGIEVFHRVCAIRVHMEVLEEEGLVECHPDGPSRTYRLRSEGAFARSPGK